MSFYRNQDKAKRNTGLLITYLVVAVVLIVSAVNLVTYYAMVATLSFDGDLKSWLTSSQSIAITLIILLTILGASAVRTAQLSRGGEAVAEMAGATPVDPSTRDPKERQLLNVTEEMAIASGSPIPKVFVMRREAGINAFVAGTHSQNTVLAVTQGALDHLTRDELQGVIGHEYSHILNGDMKLNMRLIGILAGILMIGKIGEFLARSSRYRAHGQSRRNNTHQLALLGFGLMIIGYLGLFFGRLIKSAISRQREFLADASSVQFTRNPAGIAGALYAIDKHAEHAYLATPNAEDMSHLCFGESLSIHFGRLLNSHPPIADRIKAIDPSLLPLLKAQFQQRDLTPAGIPSFRGNISATVSDFSSDLSSAFSPQSGPRALTPTAVKKTVGTPTPAHYDYAVDLHHSLPLQLQMWAHDSTMAELVLYGLLIQLNQHIDETLAVVVATWLNPEQSAELANCRQQIKTLAVVQQFPLLEIALASLRNRPPGHRMEIIRHCDELIKFDDRIQLREFVFNFLVAEALKELVAQRPTLYSLTPVKPSIAQLLALLARYSAPDPEQQRQNFYQVYRTFSTKPVDEILQRTPSAKQIYRAIQQLKQLTPLLKQPVIDACIDIVLIDGSTTVTEFELLRMTCVALDCPIPPLLPDQD